MITRIIDFSVRHRAAVIAVAVLACIAGWNSMRQIPVDALPDLSDSQVVIYSQWDRSPDIIEDQLTYPIVNALLGTSKVKTVRGISDFGYSFVYVVFEDGTDPYWARSRVLEYLSAVTPSLPQGSKTSLGPDATGLGWVFQYVLTDTAGKHSLEELRSLQDWTVRYRLRAVPGVAEVASLGGFTRQYQVNVDPLRLQAYHLPITRVVDAVRSGNTEAAGRLLEFGGSEYMIRGRGYVKSAAEVENIVLAESADGTALRVRDVATVVLGPDIRRGVADLDGRGETVSGIVVMRQGENALDVIRQVKSRIAEITHALPQGVTLIPIYDRSVLIESAISNLKWTIFEVILTVALVIVVFLWHLPSSIIPVLTMPVAILISFIPFRLTGLTANIMSLAGTAIAIGAIVDAAVVIAEQIHRKSEIWERTGRVADYREVVLEAIREVAGPGFFALLVIAVSFLPVMALEAQEGRLFRPLAIAKTCAMLVAALLVITLDPALRLTFAEFRSLRRLPRWLERIVDRMQARTFRPAEEARISRYAIRIYQPVCEWCLRRKPLILAGSALFVAATIPAFYALGSEFMPPLDEGTLFYMPTTLPGISIGEAGKLLQVTDRIISGFPEVDHVLGKAGRADTATDPAPLSMLETVISLKPRSQWRRVPTWYSSWAPGWAMPALRLVTPDTLSSEELTRQMNEALTLPGLSNAWTMPVRGRIDMLTTGIRTPLGIKIQGEDTGRIQEIGGEITSRLRNLKGTRNIFAERAGEGHFLDFEWNRESLAHYGVSIEQAQQVLASAVGGENISTAIEGRARYPINVRYLRDFRSNLDALGAVLVPVQDGKAQIPLAQLATIRTVTGPSMLRNEDGLLTGYVYIDVDGRDLSGYVDEARGILAQSLHLPQGYSLRWSGQYEALDRSRNRLFVVVPATLAFVLLLLYVSTRSIVRTMIVILAVPFSATGAVWLLWLMGYHLSVAVWVGLIALMGVDAETGVFMLLYLDLAYESAKANGRMRSRADLHEAIYEGAVRRVRPKLMTTTIMVFGLAPVLLSTGTGSDLMKRIATPLVGGIVTSFLLELAVYPVLFAVWKWNAELKPRALENIRQTDWVSSDAR